MNLPPPVGKTRISMCRMEMTTSMETFRGNMTTPAMPPRGVFGWRCRSPARCSLSKLWVGF